MLWLCRCSAVQLACSESDRQTFTRLAETFDLGDAVSGIFTANSKTSLIRDQLTADLSSGRFQSPDSVDCGFIDLKTFSADSKLAGYESNVKSFTGRSVLSCRCALLGVLLWLSQLHFY